MINPMAQSNVAIISELKNFLKEKSMLPEQRSRYVFSANSFIRKRVLTFDRIALLIVSSLKRTLSLELLKFSELFCEKVICSKQAFCEQRVKLQPLFFHDWNQQLVQSFYRHYGENVKKWKGLVVWAVDGSTLSLPATENLRSIFGWASNQSKNVCNATARVCLVSDVLNGIVISGMLHSYFSSEKEGCLKALDRKDLAGKLLVVDRGYSCFFLEYLLIQKQVKFIIRVKKNENKQVMNFLSSAETDVIQHWYPTEKSLEKLLSMGMGVNKDSSIRIRMVKLTLQSGETEILVTNLYDKEEYDTQSLKQAYSLRWGIETVYGTLKEKNQLEQFSGIRQICVEQDFLASLFLYNIQCIIEKQNQPHLNAVNKKRKYQYKINKNTALGILKEHIIDLFIKKNSKQILKKVQKKFSYYIEPVRPGRKYPRIKRKIWHGKVHTLTNYKRAL